MDILKNIYSNFKKILDNNFFKIDLLIILSLLKIIIVFCFRNYNLKIFFNYFKNTIKKTINKINRKSIFSFSIFFFLNLLISNLIDLLPLNLFKKILFDSISILPTSDINITFSFSIISFIIIIFFSIKKNGFFNFLINFTKNPIQNKYMIFFNLIIETISFIMKPISLSLRLFGNIFSSEIIFNLIDNMNTFSNIILNLIWLIFHYLILPLQAFIFITLVIIYISQLLKH